MASTKKTAVDPSAEVEKSLHHFSKKHFFDAFNTALAAAKQAASLKSLAIIATCATLVGTFLNNGLRGNAQA